jgi:hypothetical protein
LLERTAVISPMSSKDIETQYHDLKLIKETMQKAVSPKERCQEILAELNKQRDPLVRSDEVDNEWRPPNNDCCSLS